ncbi:MAG: TlpA family protein disulfide reductase [Saprospiraceae bacterium]|nr:TlpA family protein disulfide reductase [Saprospiraceae bacterium]
MIKLTFVQLLSLTLLTSLSFLHSGCSQTDLSQPAVIEGKVTLHPDWSTDLYLLKPASFTKILASYEMPVTDTIPLSADGTFHFETVLGPKDAGLYILVSQPKGSRFSNALAPLPFQENYILLDLTPGRHIELTAHVDRLSHSVSFTNADPSTREMNALQSCRKPLIEEIEEQWENNPDPAQFQWNTHGNEDIMNDVHRALDAYLDTATLFYPLMTALRLRVPDHDYRDRPEFYIQIAKKMVRLYPGHPWLNELRAHLDPANLPVLQGDAMPDFRLTTPDGDTLESKDIKGKLILVDFWASWCAPCRKEIRTTLRPLYDIYHSKGFEILGISIDSDKSSWINAIARDGATWYQASDLMGDASPVRQTLKFDTIPACYLLDEDGRLLARNLHGEHLQLFVENYFSTQQE